MRHVLLSAASRPPVPLRSRGPRAHAGMAVGAAAARDHVGAAQDRCHLPHMDPWISVRFKLCHRYNPSNLRMFRSLALFVVCLAASAAGPTVAHAQNRAFVGGLGGVTFGTETSSVFAGQAGVRIARQLVVFGE